MPVWNPELSVMLAAGFHAVQHRFDHADIRGQPSELLADLRHGRGADRLGQLARKSDEEFQLHDQPDLRLIVLKHMARGVVELCAADIDIAMNEETVPGNFDVVKV